MDDDADAVGGRRGQVLVLVRLHHDLQPSSTRPLIPPSLQAAGAQELTIGLAHAIRVVLGLLEGVVEVVECVAVAVVAV